MLATQISKDEYLSTTFHPDREWVDGVVVERNVGTQLHGLLQLIIGKYFMNFRRSHRLEVFVEARLQVKERTRIPDVMVLKVPYTKGAVTVDTPLVVVEVNSPDDKFVDVIGKCGEYSDAGVPYILVFDPEHRRMYRFSQGALSSTAHVDIATEPDGLQLCADDLFAEMDDGVLD